MVEQQIRKARRNVNLEMRVRILVLGLSGREYLAAVAPRRSPTNA